jgi:hypothetical protein
MRKRLSVCGCRVGMRCAVALKASASCLADRSGRHAAGDFTGVVPAHAIGQDRQSLDGIGKHRILVLTAHQSGVGTDDDFQRTQETVCHVLSHH